jgi:hypothetical protein
MGTVIHPKFLASYLQLGPRFGLPVMLPRMGGDSPQARGMNADDAAAMARTVAAFEATGVPLIDHIGSLPLDMKGDHFEIAKQSFDQLRPGITHFLLHPSTDTPELRAIAPDWRARVENLHTLLREDLRDHIRSIGVHVIGYRALQELMPKN